MNLEAMDDDKVHRRLLADKEKHDALERVERNARDSRTPLRTWENYMERPVALIVLPAFAFLNAGIALSADTFLLIPASSISLGIILGLTIGKPLGIVTMAWIALRMGWGRLPRHVDLSQLVGAGLMAGMGFTMSIFIAALSFSGDLAALEQAKASIMLATLLAGAVGLGWLFWTTRAQQQ